MILGPSGSGKSALALELLALGAQLVADDATLVRPLGGKLFLERPETLPRWIEARGVGLLQAPMCVGPVPLSLVVDLSREEALRHPPRHQWSEMGQPVRLLYGCPKRYFPAAVHLLLSHGDAPSEPETP